MQVAPYEGENQAHGHAMHQGKDPTTAQSLQRVSRIPLLPNFSCGVKRLPHPLHGTAEEQGGWGLGLMAYGKGRGQGYD